MNRITKALTATALAAAIAVSTLGASAATFRVTDAQLNSGITGVKIEQAERYENVGIVTFAQVQKKVNANGKFVAPLKNMSGGMAAGKRLLYIEPSSTNAATLKSNATWLKNNMNKLFVTNNGANVTNSAGYPLQLQYDYSKKMFCITVASKNMFNNASIKGTTATYNKSTNSFSVKTTIVLPDATMTPTSIKIGGQTAKVVSSVVTYSDIEYLGSSDLDYLSGWGDGQTEITVTATVNAITWMNNSWRKKGMPITINGIQLGYARVYADAPADYFIRNSGLKVLGGKSSCCGGEMTSLMDTEFCYIKKEGNTLKLWRSKGDCSDLGLAEFNNTLLYNGWYDGIDYIKMYDENNRCWYSWNVSASIYTPEYIYKSVHNSALNYGGTHEH
ncbi:MAG: hypothetical protein IJC65_02135 [Oscillospiraceae bacterium]|nr:hypothetical protein [Oscillospiraceae bacterium]